jgi:death-on-curing family protein
LPADNPFQSKLFLDIFISIQANQRPVKDQARYPLSRLERIDAARIKRIHDVAIRFGKSFSTGVRDEGSLERLEQEILKMAKAGKAGSAIAALAIERIIKDHPFWDGNHRTAFELGRFICILFDRRLDVTPNEAIGFMRAIDGKDLPTSQIQEWIEERSVPMKGQ